MQEGGENHRRKKGGKRDSGKPGIAFLQQRSPSQFHGSARREIWLSLNRQSFVDIGPSLLKRRVLDLARNLIMLCTDCKIDSVEVVHCS